jgi:hypothetical protein
MSPTTFSGIITVASRIVDQLSSGLYESPAACLKELINNSYDADASRVDVLIKPDADRIVINDDGFGMNREEFLRHFRRVSESHKRDDGDITTKGRKKIGRIGIGFIAANEICDTMEIYSTKAESTELLHVEIHFDRMRQDPAKRREKGDDFAKGDFTGEVTRAPAGEHYTQIILKRVRAPQLFVGETNRAASGKVRTLYGLGVESVEKALADPTLSSWSEFDSYSQNLLRVALNVPVEYHARWIPSSLHSQVKRFELRTKRLEFGLWYDGTPVRKPVVLRPELGKRCIISRFEFEGQYVSAVGYFYAQHGTIRPRDLQGLLLRIREAAVGGYDATFVDFPPTEGSLIQRWVSAEIWASDELEDALNIDRKTLRVTEPAFMELQEAIHRHLRLVIGKARSELYESGTEDRKKKQIRTATEKANEFALLELQPYDPVAARQFVSSWQLESGPVKGVPRNLLRKFSVVELYRIVVEVARQILSADQMRDFLRLLTRRLVK